VFARHIGQVKSGQSVTIESLDGTRFTGRIDWVAPLTLHASQSVQARVILDNAAGLLRPGQFVRARVTVAEHPVELAVRQSAIQRFRDFEVVFARFGETYEVRMLELGRRNSEWIEVLGGLKPGSEYVTGNSYLIKADIEKSGASHDH
jgi:cobalt-zinc-cadmium efflux system membrane fusion protein